MYLVFMEIAKIEVGGCDVTNLVEKVTHSAFKVKLIFYPGNGLFFVLEETRFLTSLTVLNFRRLKYRVIS